MKKIAYTRPDGGVSVVTPAPAARRKDETEEQFVERVRRGVVPSDATQVRVIDASEVPTDRTFRSAWKPDLTVDMQKAREIHRDRLRQMRAPLLTALDVAYQRADEMGDTEEKRRIATKKQALRDATADPVIDAARTPVELKVAIPDVLK